MEESTSKFSLRATLVCRQSSDPSQPIHFLSRQYGEKLSKCLNCRYTKQRTAYHLYCETCDYGIHRHCYYLPRCRLSDITRPHTLQESYQYFSSCFACGDEGMGAMAAPADIAAEVRAALQVPRGRACQEP